MKKQVRKSTKGALQERVCRVSQLIIRGYAREDIVQYSAEKWGVKERQADEYISRAKDIIQNITDRKTNYEFNLAIKRYEELFKVTFQKKDYKTALMINKELSSLQGLYKLRVQIEKYKDPWTEELEKLSDIELDQLIRDLEKRES